MAVDRPRAVAIAGIAAGPAMNLDIGLAARILKPAVPADQLAVVVIARNEERHIARCLDALMRSLESYPDTPVILVDSGSTDRTVEIACAYPVQVYRYAGPCFTAAAGRRVGFEQTASRYVLFVDGDCCIEKGWIDHAMGRLAQDAKAGLIYGQRREVFEDATQGAIAAAPAPDEYALGGNALYRADALRRAGGFNPYLKAGEEAELLGRIIACGYRPLSSQRIMFVHYTQAKTSVKGFCTRFRRGLSRGLGQTLRAAIKQRLFAYHARRLNRYLITLAYLLMGILLAIGAIALSRPILLAGWVLVGTLAFILLCIRRRSIRYATYIVADWISVAIYLPSDFLRSPPRLEEFDPSVERLRCVPTQHSSTLSSWT